MPRRSHVRANAEGGGGNYAMTVYQQCPFCPCVFEIGVEEYEPMRRHMRLTHRDSAGRGGRKPDRNDDRGTRRSSPPSPAA